MSSRISCRIEIMAALALFVGCLFSANSAFAQEVNGIWVSCVANPDDPQPTGAPSEGAQLVITKINGNTITDTEYIQDDADGNGRGWNPDGNTYTFTISIPGIDDNNLAVLAHTLDPSVGQVCGVNGLSVPQAGGGGNATGGPSSRMAGTESSNSTASP